MPLWMSPACRCSISCEVQVNIAGLRCPLPVLSCENFHRYPDRKGGSAHGATGMRDFFQYLDEGLHAGQGICRQGDRNCRDTLSRQTLGLSRMSNREAERHASLVL